MKKRNFTGPTCGRLAWAKLESPKSTAIHKSARRLKRRDDVRARFSAFPTFFDGETREFAAPGRVGAFRLVPSDDVKGGRASRVRRLNAEIGFSRVRRRASDAWRNRRARPPRPSRGGVRTAFSQTSRRVAGARRAASFTSKRSAASGRRAEERIRIASDRVFDATATSKRRRIGADDVKRRMLFAPGRVESAFRDEVKRVAPRRRSSSAWYRGETRGRRFSPDRFRAASSARDAEGESESSRRSYFRRTGSGAHVGAGRTAASRRSDARRFKGATNDRRRLTKTPTTRRAAANRARNVVGRREFPTFPATSRGTDASAFFSRSVDRERVSNPVSSLGTASARVFAAPRDAFRTSTSTDFAARRFLRVASNRFLSLRLERAETPFRIDSQKRRALQTGRRRRSARVFRRASGALGFDDFPFDAAFPETAAISAFPDFVALQTSTPPSASFFFPAAFGNDSNRVATSTTNGAPRRNERELRRRLPFPGGDGVAERAVLSGRRKTRGAWTPEFGARDGAFGDALRSAPEPVNWNVPDASGRLGGDSRGSATIERLLKEVRDAVVALARDGTGDLTLTTE